MQNEILLLEGKNQSLYTEIFRIHREVDERREVSKKFDED